MWQKHATNACVADDFPERFRRLERFGLNFHSPRFFILRSLLPPTRPLWLLRKQKNDAARLSTFDQIADDGGKMQRISSLHAHLVSWIVPNLCCSFVRSSKCTDTESSALPQMKGKWLTCAKRIFSTACGAINLSWKWLDCNVKMPSELSSYFFCQTTSKLQVKGGPYVEAFSLHSTPDSNAFIYCTWKFKF